jgi:hypothetical protein
LGTNGVAGKNAAGEGAKALDEIGAPYMIVGAFGGFDVF